MKLNTTLMEDKKTVIEGVGADAEVITNANGGKQSKSPSALHLVDPQFINNFFLDNMPSEEDSENSFKFDICYSGINISLYMSKNNVRYLYDAISALENNSIKSILDIGKVLQYGAERYAPNNWRLIPREEHLNHALIHLVALLAGDTQDDHKEHAMCRLHMAIATQETKGFSYTEPFKDEA